MSARGPGERKLMNNVIKKYGIIAIMLLASAFSIFLPIYIWPEEVANKFEAVMFEDGTETTQVITVKIDGHFNRRLFGGTKFLGEIKMEGAPLPESYQEQNIQIKFGRDQIGVLIYLEEDDGKIRLVQKGYASMPKDLSYAIIVLTEGEKVADAKAEDGLFIAGPSNNKEQSIDFVNEKLSKVLGEPIG